jgi:hypothetical protein
MENQRLKNDLNEFKEDYLFILNKGRKCIEVWENGNELYNIYPYEDCLIFLESDYKELTKLFSSPEIPPATEADFEIYISFIGVHQNLRIRCNSNEFTFNELFDKLGEQDIIQMNEIEQNYIAHDGNVYELNDMGINNLLYLGEVTLPKLGTVKELATKEISKWYYK